VALIEKFTSCGAQPGLGLILTALIFGLPTTTMGPLDGKDRAAGIHGFQPNLISTCTGIGMREGSSIRRGNGIPLAISKVPDKYRGIGVGDIQDIDCIRGAACIVSSGNIKKSANHNRQKYYIDRVFVRASAGVGDGERGPPFAKSRVIPIFSEGFLNVRRVKLCVVAAPPLGGHAQLLLTSRRPLT